VKREIQTDRKKLGDIRVHYKSKGESLPQGIQAVCGIDFTLTFHIARHTLAKTIALKSGIPLETVQIMMGHSKITTTQIYADVDEEKVLDDTASCTPPANYPFLEYYFKLEKSW
jgi:integrase